MQLKSAEAAKASAAAAVPKLAHALVKASARLRDVKVRTGPLNV
jgi:hypothetical protein